MGNYQIGTLVSSLQTLTSLGLPDPYPATFIHATEKYVDGQGRPQADGFAQAEWHFDILSDEQFGDLMLFSGEARQIAIVTRTDVGEDYAAQFATFSGYMVRPSPEDYEIEMGYWYRNVTFKFVSLVEET